MTSVQKDPRSNMGYAMSEATGWGGDHGSGVEVSGSAVSVPRVESPTKGQPIAAPISVAPISKVLSGCT